MIHIAICDDNELFVDIEKKIVNDYLSQKKQEFCIDTYYSGESLLSNLAADEKYDVVFLDIDMVAINGIETAKRLRKLTRDLLIVFVSAICRFAVDGYKVQAFRYIVKDNNYIRAELETCLEDILAYKVENEPKIELNFTDAVMKVALNDIIYVESRLHYLYFYMINNNVHKLKGTLNNMENMLNDARFCRTHQSFLLNLEYADVLDNDKIQLIDLNTNIPVTRKKYNSVKRQYLIYKGNLR